MEGNGLVGPASHIGWRFIKKMTRGPAEAVLQETQAVPFLEGYIVVVVLASPARRYRCAAEANGGFAI